MFFATETEFQKVSLVAASQDCIEARIDPTARCGDDFKAQIGEEAGSCDETPHLLAKVVSSSLSRETHDPSIPEGIRSPGYDAIKMFKISTYQIGKLFDIWLAKGADKWNYDPREATCEWVVGNFEFITESIPPGYPRIIQEKETNDWLFYGCLVLNIAALLASLGAAVMTVRQRKRRVMQYAQIEFLFLLLVGLMLVSVAAFIETFPATRNSCAALIWLADVGYTLELVPLIVKVAAINQLMQAAQRMRRVVLNRQRLFGIVFGLTLLNVVYLIIWTIFDVPTIQFDYSITDDVNESGETIVLLTSYCDSTQDFWRLVSVTWNCLLLLCATVLAVQARNIHQDFNESTTLAIVSTSGEQTRPPSISLTRPTADLQPFHFCYIEARSLFLGRHTRALVCQLFPQHQFQL